MDVQEDSLTRFYGQSPNLSLQAGLEEAGISVRLNRPEAEAAVEKVRGWIREYDWAESPLKTLTTVLLSTACPVEPSPAHLNRPKREAF